MLTFWIAVSFAREKIILIHTIPGTILLYKVVFKTVFNECNSFWRFDYFFFSFCYSLNITSAKSWPRFFSQSRFYGRITKFISRARTQNLRLFLCSDQTDQRCISYGKSIFNIKLWFQKKKRITKIRNSSNSHKLFIEYTPLYDLT